MYSETYQIVVRALAVCGFILLATVVMNFVSTSEIVSLGSDNVSYLLMAETFSPYQTATEIVREAARYQTYPPLFPLLLALLGASSDYLWAHRIVGGEFLLACVLLYFLARKMLGSAGLALIALLAFGLIPASWINVLGILSENQYLVLSLGAFLLLRRDQPRSADSVCLAVLLIAAVLTRSIGLALIVAVLIGAWISSKGEPSSRRQRTAATLAAAISFVLWEVFSGEPSESHYLENWLQVGRLLSDAGLAGICQFLIFQVIQIWEAVLTGLIHHWVLAESTFVLLLLFLLVALMDIAFRLKSQELEAIYILVFLCVLMGWGAAGGQTWRLVYPIIPLLLVFFVSGIDRICRSIPVNKYQKHIRFFLCGLLLTTLSNGGLVILARHQHSRGNDTEGYRYMTAYYQGISLSAAKSKSQAELAIIEGLRKVDLLTDPDSVVAWFSPMYVNLLSKRRSVEIPITPSKQQTEAYLREEGIDFIFLSRYHPRQYADQVNGLKSMESYASMGQLVWLTHRCGGMVGEVICVFIEIAPVSNVQAAVRSLPNTL